MVLTHSLEDRSSSLSARDTVGPTPSIVILLIVDSIEQLTASGPLLGSLLPHDNQGAPYGGHGSSPSFAAGRYREPPGLMAWAASRPAHCRSELGHAHA